MYNSLLVTVDGGPTSERTVRYVARLLRGRGDETPQIVLFHVLPPLPPSVESGTSGDATSSRDRYETATMQRAEVLLRDMEAMLVKEDVNPDRIEVVIEEDDGNVAKQIITAARRLACDTVVIGRRGQSMVSQIFTGGVAEHLLRKPTGLTVWVVD
jgi:nucleotide-binding universal stress UspA family protein